MKLVDYGKAIYDGVEQQVLGFHCIPCGHEHAFHVPRWKWNGSFDKPTFTPSLKITTEYGDERGTQICHLYMTNGKIEYLNDCWHHFKGRTVVMAESEL